MSIIVKSLSITECKKAVKDCPKIVQDYVRALENSCEGWKQCTQKAIKKLKEKGVEGK